MVIKEPLLRVVGAEVYKAIMAKIEAYEDSDRRFEGLNNSTDVDGCNNVRHHKSDRTNRWGSQTAGE